MRDKERRYRSSIGRSRADNARARIRRVPDSKPPVEAKTKADNGTVVEVKVENKAETSKQQMTYDDYLAQVKDAEKIIEVDNDSRWTQIKDFAAEYISWIGEKKEKYAPIAKEKAKTTAKTAVKKQPIDKQRLKSWAKAADTRLDPLKQRFGAKNVYFSMITGTTVLVLLGGFVLLRGGGESGEVAAVVDQVDIRNTGLDGPVQPTFDVAIPDTVNSDDAGVFFDPELGVASFRDSIRGNEVTVSQQPLTDEQASNKEEQLELIAVQLLAGQSFDSQFGTVYLSNTAPDGTNSQVALFMTDELLIFIRTGGTQIAPEGWIEYINSINN